MVLPLNKRSTNLNKTGFISIMLNDYINGKKQCEKIDTNKVLIFFKLSFLYIKYVPYVSSTTIIQFINEICTKCKAALPEACRNKKLR